MHKLAVIACLLGLGACKSREDYKDQKPPEEPEPAVAAKKEPPPPPKKPMTPEEMGKCKLVASGAVKAEQETPGGKPATNVSYWYTEAERNNMMGVDGFAVNCHGKDIKFSILPGGGKKDGMPFGPKKYTFKKGAGDANLMINFEGGKTMDVPTGTVDITAFDKHHIAGSIDLTGTVVPGKGSVKLSGTFDFVCPGFSGCE